MKQFIKELKEIDIHLSLDGENLKIKYNTSTIPAEIVENIKKNKTQLLEYLRAEHNFNNKSIPNIEASNDGYLISSSQYRLWVLSHFPEASIAFNMPSSINLDKSYDIDLLEKAIHMVIDRHEILRTVFRKNKEDEIRQWVIRQEELGFTIGYENLEDKANTEELINGFVTLDNSKPFDLEKGPLIRMKLFQLETNYVLYCNMHHIISDDWSKEILVSEILEIYQSLKEDYPVNLPELRIQYKDFANWQLAQKTSDSNKIHEDFWMEQLKGELPLADFPGQKIRPKIKTYKGKAVTRVLSKDITEKMRSFVENRRSSLFVGLLSIWKTLFYRYTNQKDIIVGIPTTGRLHKDLENQLGFYLNTLILRNEIDPDATFAQFFEEVKKNTFTAYGHQSYPFDDILNGLQLKRDKSRNSLFDILIDFHNTDLYNFSMKEGESNSEEYIKYDIEFHFIETDENIIIQAKYNVDLYEKEIISQFVEHFKVLTEVILMNDDLKIDDIEFLLNEEREILLSHSEVEHRETPKSVIEAFTKQVDDKPDNIAIRFFDKEIRYKELDELSNQLAYGLKTNHDIGINDLVGIKLDHSEWIIISILATLKLGAGYVYIDPELPESRKAFILDDAEPKLLITDTNYIFETSFFSGNMLAVDVEFSKEWKKDAINEISSEDVVSYMIYTSGSTGNPKGVIISHGSLINYLDWGKSYYSENESVRLNFGLFTSLGFDLTITSVFLPLISGNTLTICEKQDDILETLKWYLQNDISCIKLTPSHISLLTNLEIKSTSLEIAIVGGDSLQQHHIQILKSLNESIKIYNEYGPTEATVGCIVQEVSIDDSIIPIGLPIANTEVYILNNGLKIQPKGVEGELYIGGKGLALQYKNRGDLNRSKFIKNPFKPNQLLYRTGDIVKWLPGNSLAYVGRNDDQVKIRGYRIELGEVEYQICQKETIKEAVVLIQALENQEKELLGFIVSNQEENSNDIRTYLSDQLPDYMIPSQFFQLPSLPLTANGKIDKKALGNLTSSKMQTGAVYEEPRNEREAVVVEIWKAEFNYETIGVNDSFFDLGGDSIKAIRVLSKINKELNGTYEIADLFEFSTIKTLLENTNQNNKLYDLEIEKTILENINDSRKEVLDFNNTLQDAYPMSDIEIGMCYSYIINQGDAVYHDQFTYPIVIKSFDFELFKKALDLMINKHDILRTSYNIDSYEAPLRLIHEKIKPNLSFENITDLDTVSQKKHVMAYMKEEREGKPFDISIPGIWKMKIFKLNEDEHFLVFQFHHAILDGWSRASLITELNNIYFKILKDDKYIPKTIPLTYKDYILDQECLKSSKEIYDYWSQTLNNYNRLDCFTQEREYENTRFIIKGDRYKGLKQLCEENKLSMRVVNFAAYLYALRKLSYSTDILTGLVTNGRPLDEYGDKILGCFLNTTPFRFKSEGDTLLSYIKKIDKQLQKQKRFERLSLAELNKHFARPEEEGNPFFDSLFIYTDFHIYNKAYLSEEHNSENIDLAIDRFELSNTFLDVIASPLPQGFQVEWNRTRKLSSGLTNEQLTCVYLDFLDTLLKDSESKLTSMKVLNTVKKERIDISKSSNFSSDTIIDVFKEQVQCMSNKTALVYKNKNFTYKEIDELSNQLANYLVQEHGIGIEDLVAVYQERTEWMIISLLAILKSGAAYIPLDMSYPENRLNFIKEDTRYTLCISKEILDDFFSKKDRYDFQFENNVKLQAQNLAYVIYTSGSTGTPKGVMIEHRNMVSFLSEIDIQLSYESARNVAATTNIAFDISTLEIFGSLCLGKKIILIDDQSLLDTKSFIETLNKNKVEVLQITPTRFKLLEQQIFENKIESLKHLLIGGETFPVDLFEKVQDSQLNIINVYGPTETTVWSTATKLSGAKTLTVGRPLNNEEVYIVNTANELQLNGVMGEVCIAGHGLARGYLNREELTNKKFINHPIKKEEKIYKTGDLGRWLPDGKIQLFGRIDDQVKIRGYRIELGEIENVLRKNKDIQEAVVLIDLEDQINKKITAYIVSDMEHNVFDIKSYLSEYLPYYMIPSVYIPIKEIPLMVSGKIDKRSLLKMKSDELFMNSKYVESRNETDKKIIKIWEEVLEKEGVGIDDDFFDLGGNSINALKILLKIEAELSMKLDFTNIFLNPTIRHLSDEIVNSQWYQTDDRENKTTVVI